MKNIFILLLVTIFNFGLASAQSAWYNTAQTRIDTLRKGNFTIKLTDSLGVPVSDSVKIIHKKHEFPWGTAYDLYSATSSAATYTGYASGTVTSVYGDVDVYKTERYGKYIGYELPAVAGKTYKLTIKLAELAYSAENARLFDVYVDGERVMQNIDKYALCGGRNIAFDTIIEVTAKNAKIKLEFNAIKDNVSLNGLALVEVNLASKLYINCGGSAFYVSGKSYVKDASYINTTAASLFATDNDWYKSLMLKFCNYGVCGNQFKWSGIEPTKGILNYSPFENTFNWYSSVGWEMRAHTLLWGGNNSTDYHCIPQWVMALSSTPAVMYDTCKMRVMREVTRYKGRIKEYDVLNEPTHANYLQKIVGDSINWNCFKWAHEADPDARLYINDYNIIEWQDQTDNFVSLVKRMLQNGAPITGIGSQSHIGSSVDIDNFKKRFDQLGQFGLPVKITEFDMGAKSLSEIQYATEISKMMRLAFSHPAIQGFVFWGLNEPTWVPESIINIVREDKTMKIAADSVYELIHNKWTTKLNEATDSEGNLTFNGYFGDYDVLVKVNGEWENHPITCSKAEKGKTFEIIAGKGQARNPQLKTISIAEPNQIVLTFDKKMADPSGNYANFKMFSKNINYILSATLKQEDSTSIVLTTNFPVHTNEYIPVSYLKGTVASADGALLEPFGATINQTIASSFLTAKTSKDGKTIQLAFDRAIVDTSIHAEQFIVKVNNVENVVTQTKLNTNQDSITLTLTNQIIKNTDGITVSYVSNSLMTSNKLYVSTFELASVLNRVVMPKLTAITTNSYGNTITLTFDQILKMPTGQEYCFNLTSGGETISVLNAKVLTLDYKKILLTLGNSILKGDSVILNYTQGSLSSSINVPVASFVIGVTNISTTTGINDVEGNNIKCYPNPVGNELTIAYNQAFKTATVCDLLGQKLIKENIFGNQINKLNTSSLKAGLYLLILEGERSKKIVKITKK